MSKHVFPPTVCQGQLCDQEASLTRVQPVLCSSALSPNGLNYKCDFLRIFLMFRSGSLVVNQIEDYPCFFQTQKPQIAQGSFGLMRERYWKCISSQFCSFLCFVTPSQVSFSSPLTIFDFCYLRPQLSENQLFYPNSGSSLGFQHSHCYITSPKQQWDLQ